MEANSHNQKLIRAYNPYSHSNNKDVFAVYGDGKVFAREIKVEHVNPCPDYVSEKDYTLMPLSELKTYITKHKPWRNKQAIA